VAKVWNGSLNILILPSSLGTFNQLRPELEMCIKFSELGHSVTLVIGADSVYVPRLQAAGIRMLHAFPKHKISLRTIRAVRRELQSRHYDIVYASASKTIPNAAFAALGLPVKLVTYRGTTGGAKRQDPTNYLTVLNPRADGIVCVSEAVRHHLQPRVRRRTRLKTIAKGHDLSWYSKPPADLSEFGIKPTDFTIACVANARPHKGLQYLLEAAKQLSSFADIHILLVGRDIAKPPYLEMIAASHMAGRIHLTGFRDDAPELIAACSTLVLPSLRDGFPRVVMEAMGYGVPPIVTRSGGCEDVVEDGVSGYLVPVADAQAIADKILQLYNNPHTIAAMSAACRQRIANEFSCARSADRYLAFFTELLDTH
jgi:L-malate glycosyltransferase